MTISIACAACRAPNERGARFCRRCGTPLVQDVAPPLMAIACPTFGQPVTGSQKFCRGCGHPLAAVAPGSQGAARSEPAPAPAAQATAEAPSAPSRAPPLEPRASATHRMPPRQRELPVRSSPKPNAPNTRRRKIWLWAVSGGLLAAVGIAGGLVYTGKLTLPLVAQRLIQDYVPVRAPEIQVGDVWTYENFYSDNRSTNTTSSRQTNTVTAIEGDRVTVTQPQPQLGGLILQFQKVFDRQGNLVGVDTTYGKRRDFEAYEGTHHKQTYSPPIRLYDFPLIPGKAWRSISTTKAPQLSSGASTVHEITQRMTVTGKVLGWERNIGRLDDVEVDGLKLRIEECVETIGNDGATTETSTTTSTEWYVPAAERSVVTRSVTPNPNDYRGASVMSVTSRLISFVPSDTD